MLRDASWVVTALPSREPPEQGLLVDEEEERGECISLDGAATQSHRSGGEASGFIELDTAECVSVQVSHNLDCILWEAQVLHDLQEFCVQDGVERVGQVDVHDIDIAAIPGCIPKAIDEALQLPACVVVSAEPFLTCVVEEMHFSKFREDGRDNSGPEFVDGEVQAYGPLVG